MHPFRSVVRSTSSRSARVSAPALALAFVLATAGALGALAGCTSVEGSATGSTCPPASTLTYANFGQAFMDQHCNDCHAGKEKPSLTTQALVRANIAQIDKTSAAGPNATNTGMPEDSSVSDADRKKLGEWLACGAN